MLLGKIIAKPCNLLLLDEPTHHLDIESIESLIDAIEEFGGSVVIVTHSEWMLRRIAFNKLVVCHKQKQELFSGGYDEFLETVGWQEEKEEKEEKVSENKIERSRSKAIESEIRSCENRIVELEKSLVNQNEKLAELTQKARFDETKELLRSIEATQKQIDDLFDRLSKLYTQG